MIFRIECAEYAVAVKENGEDRCAVAPLQFANGGRRAKPRAYPHMVLFLKTKLCFFAIILESFLIHTGDSGLSKQRRIFCRIYMRWFFDKRIFRAHRC